MSRQSSRDLLDYAENYFFLSLILLKLLYKTKILDGDELKDKKSRHRKKGIRLFIICAEVFTLIIAIGFGFIFYKVDERNRLSDSLKRAGITEELLAGKNVSKEASDHNSVADTSRYGTLLSDTEYCKENHIFAKDTISPEQVVLAFAGDVSFADGYANMGMLNQRENKIFDCFDQGMKDTMIDADIFMVNNEFPYTNSGTPTAGKQFTFRAKPENVKYLYDMGVDIVSIANNHIYDYGEISLRDTISTLDDAAMPFVGAGINLKEAMKPVYFIANDMKIAIVSATQIERLDHPDTVGATDSSPGVFRCWYNDEILNCIKEAKENSDYVVAYIHWGTEMQNTPDWAQIQQGEQMAKAGADLIIGDHPHCLQPVTYIGETPVIYSMGNFWFNSKTTDDGLLEVTIDKNGTKSVQFIPAIQSNCVTSMLDGSEKQRVLQYMQSISPDVIIDTDGYITKNG